jgi:hypothetical protein
MNTTGATGYTLEEALAKRYKVDKKGTIILPEGMVGKRVSGFNRIFSVKFSWYHGYIIIGKKYAGKEIELWQDKQKDLHIQEV